MTHIATPADQVAVLEQLLAISVAEPRAALTAASDLVATAFGADKVDVLLYERTRDTLVALSSRQALSALEKQHGLDLLPLANGGRAVEVFVTGKTFVGGEIDADLEELRGIRETLRVRSEIGVALEVGGQRRGVLFVASLERERWTEADARFAETVGRWVGAVLQQAETVKQLAESSIATGRRMAAEELVMIVAHDVRNLLYPVDLAMHVIQHRAEREQRVEDVRDTTKARRGLARLSAIVNDVLDVSRVDQGLMTVQLAPLAIVSHVQEIATMLSTAEHAVVVTAREEVHVLADPARIRQLLENVVANALKHSPPQAAVDLAVERRTSASGPVVAISVTDRGPGVPADIASHVFDRFVTGAKRGAGLGLGLFLARQIALLHGGELVLEAAPSMGARFVLTLPCEEREER